MEAFQLLTQLQKHHKKNIKKANEVQHSVFQRSQYVLSCFNQIIKYSGKSNAIMVPFL